MINDKYKDESMIQLYTTTSSVVVVGNNEESMITNYVDDDVGDLGMRVGKRYWKRYRPSVVIRRSFLPSVPNIPKKKSEIFFWHYGGGLFSIDHLY